MNTKLEQIVYDIHNMYRGPGSPNPEDASLIERIQFLIAGYALDAIHDSKVRKEAAQICQDYMQDY